MKIAKDEIVSDRFYLIDEQQPYNGSIMFDYFPQEDRIAVCQDSENSLIRDKFESIGESVDFKRNDLIIGLKKVIEILEGNLNGED